MWMHWDGNAAHQFPWAWHSWKPKALHRGEESVQAQRRSCEVPINTKQPNPWLLKQVFDPYVVLLSKLFGNREAEQFRTQGRAWACNWSQKYKMNMTWILFSTFLGDLYYLTYVIRKQPLEQNIYFTLTAGGIGIRIILAELFTSKTEGVGNMFIQ